MEEEGIRVGDNPKTKSMVKPPDDPKNDTHRIGVQSVVDVTEQDSDTNNQVLDNNLGSQLNEAANNNSDLSLRHLSKARTENRQENISREKSVPPKAIGGVQIRLDSAKASNQ
ncbi:hypothetical protein HAX54_039382 [Datura stramonium]|uniref:Uncharacterized protein n=1 Tax=Datura stramonium TaxID=4076 RepID=A0ABS8VP33_DATST|nr:hypothetical protein [Datura stramonium]